MAKTRRDEMIDWLNDVYAMERGLEVTLRKQAQNKELHHAVRTRVGIHLDETIVHAERVCDCLAKLGSSPSPVKTIAGEAIEMAKAYSTKFTADERVKDYLASCGAEAFEVACYKSLIEAANEAGEEEIVPLLEKNLAQDSAMAHWLDMNVGAITRDYLFHMPIGRLRTLNLSKRKASLRDSRESAMTLPVRRFGEATARRRSRSSLR